MAENNKKLTGKQDKAVKERERKKKRENILEILRDKHAFLCSARNYYTSTQRTLAT